MWKKRILHSLSPYLQALLDFFFPRYCLCCRRRMSPGEEVLCVRCQADLPRVRTVSFEENDIARIFWGLVPIEKGISFFHYTPHSPHSRILFELKYHNHPEVGKTMGRMMAEELKATNFFNGIDLIVPIPLSRKKERQRGYNQSDWIAWGISEATGIPTDTTSVVRTKSNPSQTTLDHRPPYLIGGRRHHHRSHHAVLRRDHCPCLPRPLQRAQPRMGRTFVKSRKPP